MVKKERQAPDRREYDFARHHAWGGLGLLSIFFAIRLLFPGVPDWATIPIILALLVYVAISLCLTYRYRASLKTEPAGTPKDYSGEKDRLKLEKKRAKAEIKACKKGGL